MGSTKRQLPTELSVEELLSSLNVEEDNTEEETSNVSNDNVASFLMAFGIKSGNDVVTTRLFYELYRHWAKEPIEKPKFDYQLGKYLLKHQKGPKTFYLVDKNSFKITEEIQNYILSKKIDKTKRKSYKKHFEYFCTKYHLSKGSYFVESYILYYLYDKWVYGIKKQNPLGEIQFFNYCKLYFDFKRNGSSRITWFGVEKDKFMQIIDEKQLHRLRRGRHWRYGKKHKQKKQKKISSG